MKVLAHGPSLCRCHRLFHVSNENIHHFIGGFVDRLFLLRHRKQDYSLLQMLRKRFIWIVDATVSVH